ncbi:hypothetical protein WMY93_011798 [Mugilogobius chulae]|uniref:Uncharacterized protein n=1 Tax=Mugilogobius chulae TaxID=88201 RepID=A0AAW0P732_9GOBI
MVPRPGPGPDLDLTWTSVWTWPGPRPGPGLDLGLDLAWTSVWTSLETSGPLWRPLDLAWTSVWTWPGPLWRPLDLSGDLWTSLETSGPLWRPLDLSGDLWTSLSAVLVCFLLLRSDQSVGTSKVSSYIVFVDAQTCSRHTGLIRRQRQSLALLCPPNRHDSPVSCDLLLFSSHCLLTKQTTWT